MIAVDENALICDFAETYHIYDYRSLPLQKASILAAGLRENSRIKMKLSGMKYPLNTLLLASVVDRLSLVLWINTKDGASGENKPDSLLLHLLQKSGSDIEAFGSPEAFETRRKEILNGGSKSNGF